MAVDFRALFNDLHFVANTEMVISGEYLLIVSVSAHHVDGCSFGALFARRLMEELNPGDVQLSRPDPYEPSLVSYARFVVSAQRYERIKEIDEEIYSAFVTAWRMREQIP